MRPSTLTRPSRAELIGRILADHDALVRGAARHHVPEFLAIDVTMSQAKVLHLLSVMGDAGMSTLAGTMGVSLPTMSGLVDRLVEHGLVGRREGAEDRRQVLVSLTSRGQQVLDAFHEVGQAYLRHLLEALDLDDLDHVGAGMRALVRASAGSSGTPTAIHDSHPPGLGPSIERTRA